MSIKVYHVKSPTFGLGEPALFPEEYSHVATVDINDDSSSRVFELTNTIDHYWWENQLVTPAFDGEGCRSTSVGDVIVLSDGRTLRCASIGWEEFSVITDDEISDDSIDLLLCSLLLDKN